MHYLKHTTPPRHFGDARFTAPDGPNVSHRQQLKTESQMRGDGAWLPEILGVIKAMQLNGAENAPSL